MKQKDPSEKYALWILAIIIVANIYGIIWNNNFEWALPSIMSILLFIGTIVIAFKDEEKIEASA